MVAEIKARAAEDRKEKGRAPMTVEQILAATREALGKLVSPCPSHPAALEQTQLMLVMNGRLVGTWPNCIQVRDASSGLHQKLREKPLKPLVGHRETSGTARRAGSLQPAGSLRSMEERSTWYLPMPHHTPAKTIVG